MQVVPALALHATSVVLAVLATGVRFRGGQALLAAFGTLGCALLVPAEAALARFVLAVSGFAVAMRILDLRLDRTPRTALQRLWFLIAVVDTREATPRRSSVDVRGLGIVLLYGGLAAGGGWLARYGPAYVENAPALLMRWGGGVVLIYGIADAACRLAVVAFRLGGQSIPSQHQNPILATSVGAFWAKHYNRNVSAWLWRHFHRPLARAGSPRLGLLAAFAASATVHAWVAWIPLDLPLAAAMGGFFLLQGLIVVLERSWARFTALPRTMRRTWTLGWLLLTSPLFVEPFLRILGI